MNALVVVRVLGTASIVSAGFLFGRHLSSGLSLRLRVLEDLRAGLERLCTEVGYARSPLHEALLAAGGAAGEECKAFFGAVAQGLARGDGVPASHAWAEGVTQLLTSGVVSKADAEALELLGPSLGASGAGEQERHLQSAIARISVQVDHARKESLKYGAFYREMGVLVALAIVLLLL